MNKKHGDTLKNAQHMRELKNNKTEEEKRLDLIRMFEPDYDPNETPKQRFKKKCELLKKK